MVGSSILHVVSNDGRVTCKIVDFGRVVPAATMLTHDKDVSMEPPNSEEDGYFIGVRALIEAWKAL